MIRLLALTGLFIGFSIFSGYSQTYCQPSYYYGCSGGDGLIVFSLSDLYNESSCNTNGFEDFTNLEAEVHPGWLYGFSAMSGFENQYLRIWVDWDQDGGFETTELMVNDFLMEVENTEYTGDFQIPVAILAGNYRLRAMTVYNSGLFDPCGSYNFGEAEDYTLSVSYPSCYPTFSSGCLYGDYISYFSLGTIDNSSGCSANGYGDYSLLSTQVYPNTTYTLSLSAGYNNQYVSAWIDWNDDNTFDASEMLLNGQFLSTANTIYSAQVTIPNSTSFGEHKLRLVDAYYTVPTNPCGTYYYGETEEYTIELIEPNCVPTYTYGCEFGDYIQQVVLNTLNNESLCSPGGFGDYSNLSTNVSPGSTYTFSIMTGYAEQYINAWIDFNDNALFEPDEIIVYGLHTLSNGTLYSASVTIPETAPAGSHLMRIIGAYYTIPANSCDILAYGETEEYTINVIFDDNNCAQAGNYGTICSNPVQGITTDQDLLDWWKFTVSSQVTNVVVSLCGSSFDTQVEVWASCEDGNYLAHNDDYCGLSSQVTISSLPPGTYYVKVYGFNNQYGNYSLDICAETGLSCIQALDYGLICNPAVVGSTTQPYDFDWWKFDVTEPFTNAVVSLCGSTYDTKVEVWASCEDVTFLAYNDDYCGLSSEVTLPALGVGTYYVKVYGYSSYFGTYTLNICGQPQVTFECPPGSIAEAEPCGSDLNGGCNMAVPAYQTILPGETICGTAWYDGFNRDTDWFRFTLSETSEVTFSGMNQFPAAYLLLEDYCPIGDEITSGYFAANQAASLTYALNPGSYIFWVGAQFGGDAFACGLNNGYYFTFNAQPTCTADAFFYTYDLGNGEWQFTLPSEPYGNGFLVNWILNDGINTNGYFNSNTLYLSELNPGIYTLTAEVYDPQSACFDSYSSTFTVWPPCVVNAEFTSTYLGNNTFQFDLLNLLPAGYFVNWDFGDGTFVYDVSTVIHTFATDGDFYVSTTMWESGNYYGCYDSHVEWINTDNCYANAYFYTYDWGNGTWEFYLPSMPAGNGYLVDWTLTDGTSYWPYYDANDLFITNLVPGTYTMTAEVFEWQTTCYDSYSTTFTFWPPCEANADFSTTFLGNNTFEFTLLNPAPYGYQYYWDFGDGSYFVYDINTITHTYATDGDFSVVVYMWESGNSYACYDAHNEWINTENCYADANFNAYNLGGGNWEFNIPSQPFGNGYFVDWALTDGTTTWNYIDLNDLFVYSLVPGSYTITALVWNYAGCSDEYAYSFTISEFCEAYANFNPYYYGNNQYAFSSNLNTADYNYFWNFGDGSLDTGSGYVYHTYANNGQYTVSLYIENIYDPDCFNSYSVTVYPGWPAPANDSCYNATYVPGPYPYTSFGTTFGATVDDMGWTAVWYTIYLPYSSNDLSASFCGTVNSIPEIGVGCFIYCQGDTSILDVTDNTWGCDDGSTNPTLFINNLPGPGTYLIPVFLGYNPMDFQVTWDIENTNCPANAEFTSTYLGNNTFEFSLINPLPAGNNINWDFGDGTYAFDVSVVTHTFATDGDYTVSAYMWEAGNGETCFDLYSEWINTENCYLDASFSYVADGMTAYFTLNAPATGYIEWDFGDGATNYDMNPVSHIYSSPGTYVVSCYFWNLAGCSDFFEMTININSTFNCPIGSTPESEPCLSDLNGGCNMPVPAYQDIYSGTTICGTSWYDGTIRDTDWYMFTVTVPSTITITGQGQFEGYFLILNNDCNNNPILTEIPYQPNTSATGSLVLYPGVYIAWAGPDFGVPVFNCGQYYFSLDFTPISCYADASFSWNTEGSLTADFALDYPMFPNYFVDWDFGDGSGEVWDVNSVSHVFPTAGAYSVSAYVWSGTDPNCWDLVVTEIQVSEYCIPQFLYGCSEGDGITNFELNTITNPSGCSTNAYGDYSFLATTLFAGNSYNITLASGYNTNYASVWIDFNSNGLFESDEIVVSNLFLENASTNYTTTISISSSVTPGTYRLRGKAVYNAYNFDACSVNNYGEVEDYTVVISNNPCVAFANFNSVQLSGFDYTFYTWLILPFTNYQVIWDFGDGTSTSGIDSLNHTFPGPGLYTIQCWVQSLTNPNCYDYYSYQLDVPVPPCTVVADFVPAEVSATNWHFGALGLANPGLYQYTWYFGDGNSSSGIGLNDVVYNYATAGTYTVSLQVTELTNQACSDMTEQIIDVVGPHPNWNYTITSGNHTILIPDYALITIDGIPVVPGDYLGVFYHDQNNTLACAGYSMYTGLSETMAAWADDATTSPAEEGFAEGEVFTWKIWKAATNTEYMASAVYQPLSAGFTHTNEFAVNGLSGIASMAYVSVVTQNISLNLNWNIFSTYIIPSNSSITNVLTPIAGQFTIVKNGSGAVYWPQFGVNGIGTMVLGQGYQIKMTMATILPVTGQMCNAPTVAINLPNGWSYLGYLYPANHLITSMMAPISGQFVIMKNSAGQVYWPQFGVNSIINMIPGQGYQIKKTGAATFYYPIASDPAKSLVPEFTPSHFREVIQTGCNMTIGFPAESWAGLLNPGDEVGVFGTDGSLMGSGVYDGQNMALAVWGDDLYSSEKDGFANGEIIEFRIWKALPNEELTIQVIEWMEGSNSFVENGLAIVKTLRLAEPTAGFELGQNIPNPFAETSRIRLFLPQETDVVITVFNAIGEKIDQITPGNLPAGEHIIEMNASKLSPGTYFYRMNAGSEVLSHSMHVIK